MRTVKDLTYRNFLSETQTDFFEAITDAAARQVCLDYKKDGLYEIYCADVFEWLRHVESNSFEAVVTDPPYGLIEYSEKELDKREKGKGGVWRIPPSCDGCRRSPLPRFTVLSENEKAALRLFFSRLSHELARVLVPGAHVFIATNPLVSYLVYEPFI
ncbi:MAG TPA: hypothetical protein VJM83_00130, partial [Nitrospirota bacterium]|nr:hypothetical protein [Nitrospirota bacterium]